MSLNRSDKKDIIMWKNLVAGIILALGLFIYPEQGFAENGWVNISDPKIVKSENLETCIAAAEITIAQQQLTEGYKRVLIETNSRSHIVSGVVPASVTQGHFKGRLLISCDHQGYLEIKSQIRQ